jgi:flagellar M-ring protein FliF
MADLPVELEAGAESNRGGGGDFLRGYAALPIVRQLGLMLALAATVAVGVSVVLWMREPDYKAVTGITSPRQANAAAEALQAANIPYRLDDNSGTLMVPAEHLHEARMKIAGSGGLSGDQEGFELLDKDQGFGVSQFMETNMFRRSLEGELARSIMSINGVQHARVHLAIPKSTAFLRDQRAPTASVTVGLAAGEALSTGQVRAIMNLVAGAVSDLTADHVAVVDQTGQLLSGQDDDAEDGGTDKQLKFVQQLESKLREKVHNILLPTVGANRFTAEVAADVDFTWVEETEESFNPDQPALRSEQTMNEQRVGEGTDGGIPGSVSNQPPAVASAPQTAPAAAQGGAAGNAPAPAAPSRTRSQATRNFELDRTISHTRHQVGRITRLTVSVLVDDLPAPGSEDGKVSYVPWKEADLERLSALVKNAIGYNAARGDTVTVVNSPFLEEHQEPVEPVPFYTQTWFVDIVKKVVGGLLVLALVLGLLRPLYRNLSKAGSSAASDAAMARLVAMRGPNDGRYYAEMDGGQIGLIGGGQAHQSQLATVRGLVAENPARVAQVVKHWVSKDE